MASTRRMDDCVKEYLLHRGLHGAVKTIDAEIKNEKDKTFRVDKIVDQIHVYINSYDLSSLIDYWSTLDQFVFVHADPVQNNAVRKLWTSILRFYVINAVQTNRNDKVIEFFEKLATQLHSQPEWNAWFALPFTKNAEDSATFASFFNRQWQETLFLSLHNFISLMVASMKKPALLSFEEDRKIIDNLEEANKLLKAKILALRKQAAEGTVVVDTVDSNKQQTLGLELPGPVDQYSMPANVEVMDDFYLLAQDNSVVVDRQPPATRRADQIKTFIRNIGLPAPAVQGRKISAPPTFTSAASSSPSHKPTTDASLPSTAVTATAVAAAARNPSTSGSQIASRPASSVDTGSLASTASSDCGLDGNADFLLLSQDEYMEHTTGIIQCKSSLSGQTVASLDIDGVLKVWTIEPSPVTVASTMSKSMLTSLEWANKADRWLLLGTKVGSVRVFDVKEKKTIKDVVADTTCPRVIAIASNPQSSQFTCSAVGRLRSTSPVSEFNAPRVGKLSVWDLHAMKPIQHLPLSPGPIAINSLVYNHNGKLLLTGAADGFLRLYDLGSSSCIGQWGDTNTEVYTVSFSADETSCYSVASDGKLTQWSIIHKTGTKMAEFQLHSGATGPFISVSAGGQKQVHSPRGKLFSINTEGQHVLTCSQQGGVIYKVPPVQSAVGPCSAPLTPVLNLKGHRAPVVTVDWLPAVSSCLTAALDGRICVSTLLAQ